MSPRRLSAIRANGNKILGTPSNSKDAASAYKRNMDPRSSDMASNAPSRQPSHFETQHLANQIDSKQFDQMDAEIAMNKELHLVPCRWERSGWRYVQKDPADH